MAQNITLLGASYTAVPAVTLPKTGGGTARFDDASVTTATASDVASGKVFLASNGTITTGTNSGGGGGETTLFVYQGYDEVASGSYVATDLSVKVTSAGTYKCSWMGVRNTTSGTSGAQLYKNGSAVGSAHTSFTRNYYQYCEETLTLAANDTVTVYARSRNTSYYYIAANLIVEKTS